MKVILDANVLVSAAIQTGPSYRLVARVAGQGRGSRSLLGNLDETAVALGGVGVVGPQA